MMIRAFEELCSNEDKYAGDSDQFLNYCIILCFKSFGRTLIYILISEM